MMLCVGISLHGLEKTEITSRVEVIPTYILVDTLYTIPYSTLGVVLTRRPQRSVAACRLRFALGDAVVRVVNRGKTSFSFESFRIAHGASVRMLLACSTRVVGRPWMEGLKYGAAAAALRHPIGAEVVLGC